jgi:thymidylate synthase ThyX
MATFHLISDSVALVESPDFFDKIALVAHNCYQVAEKGHVANVDFVKRLIASGHLAMIEHYRFTFNVTKEKFLGFKNLYCPFFTLAETTIAREPVYFVNCSLRPLLEAREVGAKELCAYLGRALPPDIQSLLGPLPEGEKASLVTLSAVQGYLSQETRKNLSYVTYHLITDRGVTHELVRHRLCSFAQESTRYCNYTKEKFESSLTFMKPLRYEEFSDIYDAFFQKATDSYFALIEKGAKPEEARAVLPNALKASIMVTASLAEWDHIFDLRCSEAAQPDIRRLMEEVRGDMAGHGLL